jgi:hypothetical protein
MLYQSIEGKYTDKNNLRLGASVETFYELK